MKMEYKYTIDCSSDATKLAKIKEICRDIEYVVDETTKIVEFYAGHEQMDAVYTQMDTHGLSFVFDQYHVPLKDVYSRIMTQYVMNKLHLNKRAAEANNTEISAPTTESSPAPTLWSSTWFCVKKKILFNWRNKLEYLVIIFLVSYKLYSALDMTMSGFVDINNGEKIDLDLTMYGNTTVYYSTIGFDNATRIEGYFKHIITSAGSSVRKVNNVPKTLNEEGDKSMAIYTQKLIIAIEFQFTDNQLNVVNLLYSNKALHGAPISINLVMNALLKGESGGGYSISATNAPLYSFNKKKQAVEVEPFSNVVPWLIILPSVPLLLISHFLYLPATERVQHIRTIDKLYGVTTSIYWLVYGLLDIFQYMVVVQLLYFTVYSCVSDSIYLNVISCVRAILLWYGAKCIPYAYIFITYFDNGNDIFFIGNMIISPILALALSPVTENYYILLVVSILNPPTYLSYVLFNISAMAIENRTSECYDLYAPNLYILAGCSLGHILVYMLFLCLEDLRSGLQHWFIRIKLVLSNSSPSDAPTDPETSIHILKTYKKTDGSAIATIRAELKLKKGLCVGLLGGNGAGKTTIFRILTKEEKSESRKQKEDTVQETSSDRTLSSDEESTSGGVSETSSDLRLLSEEESTPGGVSALSGIIGYCPQRGGLLENLTAKDLLHLYGNLTGQQDVGKIVKQTLKKLSISHIAHRPCDTYCSGAKQGLSVSIAVIGRPNWVLLDEPTCGVDHVTRLNLLDMIKRAKNHSGVLFSTHNLDDCHKLCEKGERLYILTNGEASRQMYDPLKKYHKIVIRIKDSANQAVRDDILKILKEKFTGATCDNYNKDTLTITVTIPSSDTKTIMDTMNERNLQINIAEFRLRNIMGDDAYWEDVHDLLLPGSLRDPSSDTIVYMCSS